MNVWSFLPDPRMADTPSNILCENLTHYDGCATILETFVRD